MPFTNNRGTQIHFEIRGQGEPLLLVHGMFLNWKIWRDCGYVQALEDRNLLIMVDVRGHGLSAKPHDPDAYEISLLVSDLIAVLDDLGVQKAHYLGYSMGAWIGFGAAKFAPERFHSFTLGGWQPYADRAGHQPNPVPVLQQQGNAGIVAWLEKSAPLTEEQKTDLLNNDVEALILLAQNRRDDYRDILHHQSMPWLLYCGDADIRHDDIQACASELSDAIFVSLPGYDHPGVIFHGSPQLLPHVREFLRRYSP